MTKWQKYLTLTATLAAAALTWTAWPAATARAADPGGSGNQGRSTVGGSGPITDELDPPTRAAVDKGLAWLAKNVNPNGNNEGSDSVAVMALAGLAFLADGSLPNSGRYGTPSRQIMEFILKNCTESGLVAAPNNSQPMYGHGFATLYLAEVYGMSPPDYSAEKMEDIREKVHQAVKLIVRTQQPNVGGWRYQPQPNDSDISVTICQIMALRAARNDGIAVPKETIDGAISYVKRSQEPDGGFRYTISGGGSAYPRSAAGVACLYYTRTGDGFADEIKRGVGYLKQRLPDAGRGDGEGNFFYGNYYATQAMFMYGGDAWEAYWPSIKKVLLSKQDKNDGKWTGETGQIYATSMALIMLQVPNRLLPILQR
jgi:hypothetical protein